MICFFTWPVRHNCSAHADFRMAKVERKSCGVSSREPPTIGCSTDFGERPMVRPDSWGRVPSMGRTVQPLRPRRGCPIDTGPTPLLRIFSWNLRHTVPSKAFLGESVGVGDGYSADNLRLLTWVGLAMPG